MVSIDWIIQRAVNPFDSTTFRPGNFWQEDQDSTIAVASIHQEAIANIESILDRIQGDRRTRTILLAGDSGSGKSYLLGRLKHALNSKAFFAYIGPWPESDYIWRHTLRNTVDSLMQVPAGGSESQLLIWLRHLSAFQERGLLKNLMGERKLFIHNLKLSYPSGIYNPSEFFGILHDLTDPQLYPIACEWLKGDILDEESLKALQVKRSLDSESAAQNMLANFGRIASATQPIVLCFDNLDNIDRALDGFIDLQALFNVNSMIHNQKLKNFLVIISIITNTWKQNHKRVQGADIARIDYRIPLQPINLDDAEALWVNRLRPIHANAEVPPPSPIYPLSRQALEAKFPGGKTLPRSALMLGRQLFQAAKGSDETQPSPGERSPSDVVRCDRVDALAAFKLVWRNEFNKSKLSLQRIRQFSAPELIQMLREAIEALGLAGVQPKLLSSPTYSSYSLSYYPPVQLGRVGVVWTEDSNLTSFCNVMKACQKAVRQEGCRRLHLIRAEGIGSPKNQGYKRYQQLFSQPEHRHIVPELDAVRYLATYHSLVNAARAGELVAGDRAVTQRELEELTRQCGVLENCSLLWELGAIGDRAGSSSQPPADGKRAEQEICEFLLALVKTQQLVGRQVLVQHAIAQFPDLDGEEANAAIDRMCDNGQIQILDPRASWDAQLIICAIVTE